MNNIETVQKQFGDYLFNFIKARVNSVHDAEDIYQEVLIKISANISKVSNTQSLKSWLFTIARNKITDYYRTKKDILDIDSLSIIESLKQEDETNGYKEMESCLMSFIDALPNDYRDAIKLSEIEGRSQKEVADNLGVNYVTLRSKVQRGRDKIRKMILNACILQQDNQGRVIDCNPNPEGACAKDDNKSCSN
jgi:RNA polymerase sigma-70 factor, ECF subfamily